MRLKLTQVSRNSIAASSNSSPRAFIANRQKRKLKSDLSPPHPMQKWFRRTQANLETLPKLKLTRRISNVRLPRSMLTVMLMSRICA